VSLADAGRSVLIQGITGHAARRHTAFMREYGTNIVAGVAPRRGGVDVDGVPVFETVADAVDATGATTTVAFLPARAVADGLVEAAEAGIRTAVSVTEGVSLHDVVRAAEAADGAGMRIIGPNCPGMLSADRFLLGFLPTRSVSPGGCAVLSRSGTLSYEAVYALGQGGLGVSLWVGVGGDRVKGSSFEDLLPEVLADHRTEALVLIGEIGGSDEELVADALRDLDLPTVAMLAGASAPEGVALGHAGAIVEGGRGTYAAKRAALEAVGVVVVDRPSELPAAVRAVTANEGGNR